ncbi:MAG: DUF3500 domain-containing protein [Gemmatales bacterium]
MLSRRQLLRASVAYAFASSVLLAQDAKKPQAGIVEAGDRLLDAVGKSGQEKLLYQYEDAERFNWDFVPLNNTTTRQSTRKGIMLDDLNADGKGAALALLQACTSKDGYQWCLDIMAREAILAELEPRNAWFRKPGWYFITFYGKPARTGRWGWRLDGHHLSVNCTIVDGQLASATPCFMGLNPVKIMHGPHQGERRTITASEDEARTLVKMLTPEQARIAVVEKHLPEVKARTKQAPALPTGLAASKMSEPQQAQLLKLVQHYFGRMPAAQAQQEEAQLMKSGLERLTFHYTGETDPGKRHTYVIQGPSLFIHYMNEQTDPHRNPANHIHSVYRSKTSDFGHA